MKLRQVVILLLALTVIPFGSRRPTAAAMPPQSKADEGTSKFETWASAYFENPGADVTISNAENWFASHFEAESASRLFAEYDKQAKMIEGLAFYVNKVKQDGNTELRFRRADKAIDMDANGLQNALMQRMTKAVPLFTLVMAQPGEEHGTTLWSFVEVDGRFCFLGKMESLNPTKGDLITDVLCQLPLGDAEELLKNKGLETSAVEHLRAKGILK